METQGNPGLKSLQFPQLQIWTLLASSPFSIFYRENIFRSLDLADLFCLLLLRLSMTLASKCKLGRQACHPQATTCLEKKADQEMML